MKRDCQCPKARHEHGTPAAYNRDGCRCDPCRAADAKRRNTRRRAAAYGRPLPPRHVDPTRARAYVASLRDLGLSYEAIAEAAGVKYAVVLRLMAGTHGNPPAVRIEPETERRLLAARPTLDNVAGHRFVAGIGTARRIQALQAIGYDRVTLGRLLGVHADTVDDYGNRPRVEARIARKVRDLYDRLWDKPRTGSTPGEKCAATIARNTAARHGWPVPMAWDEDIDDPAAIPYTDTLAA